MTGARREEWGILVEAHPLAVLAGAFIAGAVLALGDHPRGWLAARVAGAGRGLALRVVDELTATAFEELALRLRARFAGRDRAGA